MRHHQDERRTDELPLTPELRSHFERSPPPPAPATGRVLCVKQGYNPNSSSIGSIVFPLPVLILGASAVLGSIAGLIWSAFLGREEGQPVEAVGSASSPQLHADREGSAS